MSDNVLVVAPSSDLGDIAGPPFLGIFLNGYLFGLLTLQYYIYCHNFPDDLKWLKTLVHIQFILETAQTVMSVADGFHWFVYGYGDLKKLSEFYLANIDSPIMCSVIALISQGVYCWRIYHLSRWKTLMLIIGLAACCQAVGGISIGIINHRLGSILKWEAKFNVFLFMWAVASAVTDTIIACSMSYLLLSSKCFASVRSTVMTRLARLVIETNAASALVAIAVCLTTVITPIAPPKTSYFMCPGYILGKLYSNSFIMMLNNRSHSKGTSSDSGGGLCTTTGELLAFGKHQRADPSCSMNQGIPNITVAVHTEVQLERSDQWKRPSKETLSKPRSILPDMA